MAVAYGSTERDGGAAVPKWDYQGTGERLSARLERELTARAQHGDRAAWERILNANVPLVVSLARPYRNPHLDLEDLVQEGMIGLCTAIERFDGARGFRFSTYATYWIRQRILRSLDRQGRLIRLPVDVGYAARKAVQAREELTERLGREPTLDELAEVSGISAKRLEAVLACMEEPLSFEAALTGDPHPLSLEVADADAADPEDEVLRQEEVEVLEELLETLPARDRLVLENRFGLNGASLSLADLAQRLRMTTEGVRQVQRRALLKLRRKWEGTAALAA
ncbi:MAG: RNA polymerase sigma factor RpoD/SigA [Armatimonadota bacterium]